jgi:surface antigen
MLPAVVIIVLGSIGLAGCASVWAGGGPPAVPAAPALTASAAETPAPTVPTGAALGGVLGGPVGASLTDDDRAAAWSAQIAALDSGQRRSWRAAHGVFGFVEPGPAASDGCRAYAQTIYVAGRPNRGRGTGCKQPDGSWKMAS